MLRLTAWAALALAAAPAAASAAKYSIKTESAPAPKDLAPAIAGLLGDRSVVLLDDKGTALCQVWLRKEVPAKATAEQVKNGLSYRELDESTVLGALRVEKQMTDYRKQKIKPGVYTIRLGFQPMDGDHMGTAPYPEFGLLIPAKLDTKPEPMPAKELQEMSNKAARGTHPAVFLLFPNTEPKEQPKLASKEGNAWVLEAAEPVSAAGQKGTIGIGLTLIGHSQ